MATTPKNTLTGWVVRFWKPKVSQVLSWMDSYWHKDDPIPINNIMGLQNYLNSLISQEQAAALLQQLAPIVLTLSADGTYAIPAGKILAKIRFESQLEQTLAILDQDSGEPIASDIELPAQIPYSQLCNVPAGNSAQTIMITGVTSPVTLRIYLD